jgi:hypothetical protein
MERLYFYACSSFHHRGKTVCANSPEMRLEDAEHAVLTALARTHAEAALSRLTQADAKGGADATLLQAIRDQERRHDRSAPSWRIWIGRASCR